MDNPFAVAAFFRFFIRFNQQGFYKVDGDTTYYLL
jgi:hypothetical protein